MERPPQGRGQNLGSARGDGSSSHAEAKRARGWFAGHHVVCWVWVLGFGLQSCDVSERWSGEDIQDNPRAQSGTRSRVLVYGVSRRSLVCHPPFNIPATAQACHLAAPSCHSQQDMPFSEPSQAERLMSASSSVSTRLGCQAWWLMPVIPGAGRSPGVGAQPWLDSEFLAF